jgi:transforming growth factor-beta-induced protein
MKTTSTILAIAALSTATYVGTAANMGDGCSSKSQTKANSASMMNASYEHKPDIIDTAVAAGSFNTLAAALTEAGLIDALKGDGPFTVFAPTDEAFAKLPEGTVEALLKPENRDQLIAILTYHVVPGRLEAGKVLSSPTLTTLNGQRADINGGNIDGATIIKTDIECSNGVIHVIDEVILPESGTIIDVAVEAGVFGTLAAALGEADLIDALNGEGPFTVFAPTDEAFAKLPAGTVESLLKPENRDQLKSILLYHVVEGRVYSDDAIEARKAKTLEGTKVKITESKGKVMINGATVVSANIDASNGVIHVIDQVILPSGG